MRSAKLAPAVLLSGLAIAACGAGDKRASTSTGSYAACGTSGDPAACLRFLNHAVGVNSIQLTAQVPSQVAATCVQTSRLTDLRVTCPPLVPGGGVVGDHDLYGPQVTDRRSYSFSINNGENAGPIHWEVGATSGPVDGLWIFDRASWDAALPKRRPRMVETRRYLGQLVTLYRFPDSDGQLEGHDAAFAAKHGVTYFASIHGHNHDDGDIAMLLAILARTH